MGKACDEMRLLGIIENPSEWSIDRALPAVEATAAGDPLSPYSFLLCVEGFSAMLGRAEMEGKLRGIKICYGTPSASQLLFADDSLMSFGWK